jgi:hypothetical protein
MNPSPIQILVAGAQKAGTTSLSAYLQHHPSIFGHVTPELPYFVDDDMYERGWDAAARRCYERTGPGIGQLRLAKSAGVCFLPAAAARAHHHNPQMRVLVVLRDPVHRAVSAYRYFLARGLEPAETFHQALAIEEERLETDHARNHRFAYVGRGLYADQVQRLIELFGREHVHVSVFEEFVADPQSGLQELCDWLGLARFSEDDVGDIVSTRHNVTETVGTLLFGLDRLTPAVRRLGVPPSSRVALRRVLTRRRPAPHVELAPAVGEQLRARFAEPNEELYRLLGRRIDLWEGGGSAVAR